MEALRTLFTLWGALALLGIARHLDTIADHVEAAEAPCACECAP